MLIHFLYRLQDHYLWLLGLLFMVEPCLDYTVIRYRDWADHFVSRKLRTRIAISLAILAAFAACFLAFQDEYNRSQTAIGERDEARRQLSTITPANQQHMIERLSADLTAARGQIDSQKETIERQQEEINKLKPKPARHLTDADRQNLTRIFGPLKEQFKELQISATEGEPQGYAREFMAFFKSIGINVPRVGIVFAVGTSDIGLQVVFKDGNNIPDKANIFMKAIGDAGFLIRGTEMETMSSDDEFIFIVAPQ